MKRPKVTRSSIAKAVESLLETGARKATLFQHPTLSVTATRQHRPDGHDNRTTILLTTAPRTYRGRKFVKDCLRAGEKFPVRNVQLTFYPIRRKK